jgi:putative transposase
MQLRQDGEETSPHRRQKYRQVLVVRYDPMSPGGVPVASERFEPRSGAHRGRPRHGRLCSEARRPHGGLCVRRLARFRDAWWVGTCADARPLSTNGEDVPMPAHRSTEELLTVLETENEVAAPTLRRVREEIPSYAAVADDLILAAAHRNLRRAVQTLRDNVVPDRGDIWEAETSIRERLTAGVPIEDVMAGFRVSISCIQDRLSELADGLQMDGAEVVRLTRLLWKLSDVFSAQAAASYRQHGLARDLAEQRVKDQWVLAALTGPMTLEQVQRGVTLLGLDADGVYVPFCTGRGDDAALATAQRELEHQFRGAVCLVVPREQHLMGLLAHIPEQVTDAVLVVGPASGPAGLHRGFATAQRVLRATAPTESGVHSLDSLGWRVGVPSDPELSEFLRARYLDPLHGGRGSSAPVADAVRTYLEHDRSIPRAAAAMHVHVNTLRYRLARFEELTGRSLSDTDTVIEVSWALRHAQGATS